MYDLDKIAEILNIKDQLPYATIMFNETYMYIYLGDINVSVYGWPDNRICVSKTDTGRHRIYKFGQFRAHEMREKLLSVLEDLGVDTGAIRYQDM